MEEGEGVRRNQNGKHVAKNKKTQINYKKLLQLSATLNENYCIWFGKYNFVCYQT